jgi:hypothetical protein
MSISVQAAGTDFYISAMIIPVCSTIGIFFGRTYAAHIAIGTLPLLLGIELLDNDRSLIRFRLIGSDIYFANLLIFWFLISQSFQRRLFSAKRLSIPALLFIFVGLSFYFHREDMARDAIDFGLRDSDKASFWFKTTGMIANSYSYPPHIFVVSCLFLIGMTKARLSVGIASVVGSWLAANSIGSLSLESSPISEMILFEIVRPTFLEISFAVDCIFWLVAGRTVRLTMRANRRSVSKGARCKLLAMVLAIPPVCIASGAKIDSIVRVSSEEALVFDDMAFNQPKYYVVAERAQSFYVDRILSWAQSDRESDSLAISSEEQAESLASEERWFPESAAAASTMSISDFTVDQGTYIHVRGFVFGPLAIVGLLFLIGFTGGFSWAMIAILAWFSSAVLSTILTVSGPLHSNVMQEPMFSMTDFLTVELEQMRSFISLNPPLGGNSESLSPDFLAAFFGVLVALSRSLKKRASEAPPRHEFDFGRRNGTTVVAIALGIVFLSVAILRAVSALVIGFSMWL